MLFVFGLVIGIALTAILGGGSSLPGNDTVAQADEKIVVDTDDTDPVAQPSGSDVASVPIITSEDHVRGDETAPLTWIEYSDFECPFCKRFAPSMEDMLEDYEGQIKLVYRHFPLSFHRPLALTQAEASECANEYLGNDGFWAMHDFIFDTTSSNGNGMTEQELVDYAVELGINESTFQTCLDDDRYVEHIENDLDGGAAAGVTGTPGSIFIDAEGNAQLISGAVPYSQIQLLIDAVIE